MDMKRILQAIDGVAAKPVEGGNDMKKFLSIVDKNANVQILTEGDPHKVSLPVQMAMQHYQKPASTPFPQKKNSILRQFYTEVETEIAEEKAHKRQLINQYSQKIAERVLMKESKNTSKNKVMEGWDEAVPVHMPHTDGWIGYELTDDGFKVYAADVRCSEAQFWVTFVWDSATKEFTTYEIHDGYNGTRECDEEDLKVTVDDIIHDVSKHAKAVMADKHVSLASDDDEQLHELSTEKLSQYKTAAGKSAAAADKAGDYETGNKRFKGIVKATKKQFDNDAKKHQGVAEGATSWDTLSSHVSKGTHEQSAVSDLMKDLRDPLSYDAIDHLMTAIAKKHNITEHDLHILFVKHVGTTPDVWIRKVGEKKDKWSMDQHVSEVSKDTLRSYIKKNKEDTVQRASSDSFKSGKSGDKYNTADETHKDKMRDKGMDRALNKLFKENFNPKLGPNPGFKPVTVETKFSLNKRTMQMEPEQHNDDEDRHGVYVDGKLHKTYWGKAAAERVASDHARKHPDADIKVKRIMNETDKPTKRNPVAHAAQKVAKGAGVHKNKKREQEVPRTEKYKKSPMSEELDELMEDPCWKGYKQIGMKKKQGKKVPNCVPKGK